MKNMKTKFFHQTTNNLIDANSCSPQQHATYFAVNQDDDTLQIRLIINC